MKGEAVSPAYLIHTVRRLYPQLHPERAEEPESFLELLETPSTGMDYLLEILGSHMDKYEEPLFQELYSWYLRSPE